MAGPRPAYCSALPSNTSQKKKRQTCSPCLSQSALYSSLGTASYTMPKYGVSYIPSRIFQAILAAGRPSFRSSRMRSCRVNRHSKGWAIIAPKALERFKRRVREITRRAKGVSTETTIEELAPYMRGLAQLLRLLRNTYGTALPHPLGPIATTSGLVAAVENTAPSPGGSFKARGLPATGPQHGKQRAWPLASRPNQGSHCGAF